MYKSAFIICICTCLILILTFNIIEEIKITLNKISNINFPLIRTLTWAMDVNNDHNLKSF